MGRKLYRDERNRVVGGVAAGLADYLDMDVTLVRILFIVLAIFGLSGVLIYIILWIALPKKLYIYTDAGAFTDPKNFASPEYSNYSTEISAKKPGSGRYWVGLILIALGLIFLFREFDIIPYWLNMRKLWPVFIIVLGAWLLFRPENYQRKSETIYGGNEAKADVPPASETSPNTDQPII